MRVICSHVRNIFNGKCPGKAVRWLSTTRAHPPNVLAWRYSEGSQKEDKLLTNILIAYWNMHNTCKHCYALYNPCNNNKKSLSLPIF